MTFDTRLNLNGDRFEQCSNDTINLFGCTQMHGQLNIKNSTSLIISHNAGIGKVLTSNAAGVGTWQTPTGGINISGSTVGGLTTYINSTTICSQSGLMFSSGVLSVAGNISFPASNSRCIKIETSQGIAVNGTKLIISSGIGSSFGDYYCGGNGGLLRICGASGGNSFFDNGGNGGDVYLQGGYGGSGDEAIGGNGGNVYIIGGCGGNGGNASGGTVHIRSGSDIIGVETSIILENYNGTTQRFKTTNYGTQTIGIDCATISIKTPIVCGTTCVDTHVMRTNNIIITPNAGIGKVLTSTAAGVGTWQTPTGGNGTVTSISAGNGMSFNAITGAGTVSLGTPATLSLTSSNLTTTSSHTHALSISSFTSSNAGLTPASGGGTVKYLRADGTWQTPTGGINISGSTVGGLTTYVNSTTICSQSGVIFSGGVLSVAGNILVSGEVTMYSDERLKENIITLNRELDNVMKLNPVSFNKINDNCKVMKYGLIAQELQKTYPQFVSGVEECEHFLSVNYASIVSVLIKSIQDLKNEVDELKNNLIK